MDLRSWGATAEGFARHLRATGKSADTVRTYLSAVSLFWRWCEAREDCPVSADRSTVRDWIALRRDTVSNGRAHNSLAALRSFYAWLNEDGEREDDPCVGARIKRAKRNPTKPLRVDEFSRLMSVADRERDQLMLLVLGHTGVRISELAGIEPTDFDWSRGLIRIKGKGDKHAYIAPPCEIMDRLRIFLGLLPDDGPIWRSAKRKEPMSAHQIRKIIYGLADEAGVEHVHPHRLRALFATEHYRNYHDIERLRRSMRHESIETTQSYISYLEEEPGYEQMRAMKLGV